MNERQLDQDDFGIVRDALGAKRTVPPFDAFLFSGPDFSAESTRTYRTRDGVCMKIGEQIFRSFVREQQPVIASVFDIKFAPDIPIEQGADTLHTQKFIYAARDMGSFAVAGLFVSQEPITLYTDAADLPLPLLAYYWKAGGISAESPLLANAQTDPGQWQSIVERVSST